MRLLLSDGTAVPVAEYTEGTASIEGFLRRTVTFVMVSTTLEEVNGWFEDKTRLPMIHLYSDDNDLINDYNGFQYRVQTGIINSDDGKYSVTLAETSDTAEQVRAIQTSVNQNTEAVRRVEDAYVRMDKNISAIISGFEETSTVLDSLNTTMGELQQKVLSQDERISESDGTMRTTIESNKVIKEQLTQIKTVFQTINNTYQAMVDDIAATKEFSNKSTALAQNTKNAMNSLQSTIEGHSTSLEQLARSAETLQVTQEEQQTALSAVDTTLKEQSSTLVDVARTADTIKRSQETVEETARSLENRVTNLEPVTDVRKMTLADAKAFRIAESQRVLAEYLENHPIISSCHGEPASYSITKEKQGYLQAMILTTQMAMQAGVEYHPSWNATGEPCTYDWTLEQLQQLAFEIESVVRPLVSKQQAIETTIATANTMDEIVAIQIYYGEEPEIPEESVETPSVNYPESLDPSGNFDM